MSCVKATNTETSPAFCKVQIGPSFKRKCHAFQDILYLAASEQVVFARLDMQRTSQIPVSHQVVLQLVRDVNVPVCSQVSDRLQQVSELALLGSVVNTHEDLDEDRLTLPRRSSALCCGLGSVSVLGRAVVVDEFQTLRIQYFQRMNLLSTLRSPAESRSFRQLRLA